MTWTFVALVAGATLAAALGGLAPALGRRPSERLLHSLLGLAAGLMVGVTFLRILPRTFALGGSGPAFTLGASFVTLYVFEGIAGIHGHSPHEHARGHREGDHFAAPVRTPWLAVLGLTVHMFLDGLILAPAFAVDETLGLATAAAVIVHKIPGGFATGTILTASDLDRGPRVAGVVAVASTTALGGAAGLALVEVGALVPHLLALAAGTLLFVAVAELLPELHHGPHKGRVVLGLVVGFTAIASVGWVLASLT